jgi:phage terminase small subunit
MALTPKQQRFVEEYLIDLNATQAYMRAGYKVSESVARRNGHRLLTNADVAAEIGNKQAMRSERTEITADYVLNTIVETVERCRQAEAVTDKTGKQVMVETEGGELAPAYVFDSKAVLKGCELLGKHLALFTDKHEVTGADGGPVEITVVPVRPAHEDTD